VLTATILKSRIEESVRTMKGLHSVVCGVAVTAAIKTVLDSASRVRHVTGPASIDVVLGAMSSLLRR
jgi:hypothetical protein